MVCFAPTLCIQWAVLHWRNIPGRKSGQSWAAKLGQQRAADLRHHIPAPFGGGRAKVTIEQTSVCELRCLFASVIHGFQVGQQDAVGSALVLERILPLLSRCVKKS